MAPAVSEESILLLLVLLLPFGHLVELILGLPKDIMEISIREVVLFFSGIHAFWKFIHHLVHQHLSGVNSFTVGHQGRAVVAVVVAAVAVAVALAVVVV